MMNAADDFISKNEICSPLIGIYTSDAVDTSIGRNRLNFADLLIPFSTTQISIKDPFGQLVNRRLHVDIRDLRKNGFLLSHTVLPFVVQENALSTQIYPTDGDIYTHSFKDFFQHWVEPSEYDFLRAYICCIFAILSTEADPLRELERIQSEQHKQQHGGTQQSSIRRFSPSYCAAPKWFMPNILKFYVLVQDLSTNSEQHTEEIFTKMCKNYGSNFCHLLRLNSSERDISLPDPWSTTIQKFNRGIQPGLKIAKEKLLSQQTVISVQNGQDGDGDLHEKFNGVQPTTAADNTNGLFTITTGMQKYALNEAATNLLEHDRSLRPVENQIMASYKNFDTETINQGVDTVCGQYLSVEDRERIRKFFDEFIRVALVPFVERQIVEQHEIILSRRGIGKSFSNMRKWLGTALSNSQSSQDLAASSVRYGLESTEIQTRRLADLAFQFGLYNFSLHQYQSLKADFGSDQAWVHAAASFEMAAVSSFLLSCSNIEKTSNLRSSLLAARKQYPIRYIEGAINNYISASVQSMLPLRCVLISVNILETMELYSDAAYQLVRLTNELKLPPIFNAILLEHSALIFGKTKMHRRMAFYSVLAANYFFQLDTVGTDRRKEGHILRCCSRALPLLKGWKYAESHIKSLMSFEQAQSDESTNHTP